MVSDNGGTLFWGGPKIRITVSGGIFGVPPILGHAHVLHCFSASACLQTVALPAPGHEG